MLTINNLSFYYGSRIIYEDVSLHVKPKDKIGLIGANGTGKSTLLRIINGEYKADKGDISKSKDCTIGFLNQDHLSYQTEDSILSVAMEAFEREQAIQKEIDKVLLQMETNYEDKLVDKLSKLQDEFSALDGYTIQSKSEEVLEGLGFKTEQLSMPLKQFSGGWRMRVMLAKMLLAKPALLMLDEPTNHLDLPAIEWLEAYINSYEGATIVVTHDREFLDKTCSKIAEVSRNTIDLYNGNYSFYQEEKVLRAEIQNNAFKNQQQQIKQAEQFITRFKAKATKARQVQSRVKALEKMDKVDEVQEDKASINFSFQVKKTPGKIITELKGVEKSYGDLKVLESSDTVIQRGDKIALVGANGIGKSTLLRVVGDMEPIEGEISRGHNVEQAMFAQHQLEDLTVDNTILQELVQTGIDKSELELRKILGHFMFTDDDVEKKVKVLSGGERSRVALAKTLISESNFLLLDEPTNHLDIKSVNILASALKQYEGTFIVVSHDRHFVSEIANKIWYIHDRKLKEYPGTFAEYLDWYKKNNLASSKQETTKNVTEKPKNTKPKKEKTPGSKTLYQLNQELEEVENKIADFETQKEKIETELSSPEILADNESLAKKSKEYEIIQEKIADMTQQWENLAFEIDEINS